MNPWQSDVQSFHREVIDGPTSPAEPKLRNPELRARLILEEAVETAVALIGTMETRRCLSNTIEDLRASVHTEPNLVEAIDGIVDTIYVCLGAAESIGIDLDDFWDEVQRSNMAKVGGERRADGKWLKPSGWTPPDLTGVLAKVRP